MAASAALGVRVCLAATLLVLISPLGASARGVVTKQGDASKCSLLMNSATAVKGSQEQLDAQSAPLDGLKALLDVAGFQGEVTHYPVVAVMGGHTLVSEDEHDLHINLSPAVQQGNEICFLAMATKATESTDIDCKATCTQLQESQVSMTFQQTDMGQMPFLLVGEDAQDVASCQEIIYPDYRTALGWMCHDSATGVTSNRSAAAPALVSLVSMLLALVASVALL